MRDKRGFTIIQIMVVIAIIGIIAGISIPRLGSYTARMRLERAKHDVLSALKLASAKAKSEGKIYVVAFNEETNTYKEGIAALKDGDDLIATYGPDRTLPEGVSIVADDDGEACYVFFPSGQAAIREGDDDFEIDDDQEDPVAISNTKNHSITFHLIYATGIILAKKSSC